jgi:hypothetical protein
MIGLVFDASPRLSEAVATFRTATLQTCPREKNQTNNPDKAKNIPAMTPKMTQKFDDRLC